MATETLTLGQTQSEFASTLPVVAETSADCSSSDAPHSHSHHDHVGGCCATTSPAAAAAAVEKANSSVASFEEAAKSTATAQGEIASADTAATVDDAALIEALREVIDPELMINIVDLGLVYSINHTDRKVAVDMTLTSPACPAGPQIIMQSKMALERLEGVDVAEIKLVMSPPWTPARMTDEARDQLGIF